jgi:threonine/homoserine/homoserine lactone efflux protein
LNLHATHYPQANPQTADNAGMNWEEFTALLILATAMSFTPGPNTTLSTALAANHGLQRALRFACAVPVGWGLLLSACALGVGTLVQTAPPLQWGIKAMGCGYLVLLATRLWGMTALTTASENNLQVGFVQGVGLQFLNLKAWMLALTLVSGWMVGKPNVEWRFVIVLLTMMCYAFCSNLTYAVIGSVLGQWLAQGKRLMVFNRIMSGVLAATAMWMLTV